MMQLRMLAKLALMIVGWHVGTSARAFVLVDGSGKPTIASPAMAATRDLQSHPHVDREPRLRDGGQVPDSLAFSIRGAGRGINRPADEDAPADTTADLRAGLSLTADERDWLATLPVLRIGVDPTATPLTMTSRDGDAEGMSVDYMQFALDLLGVRTQTVVTRDWADTVRAAAAGNIDMLPAASARNAELSKRFLFTRPYIELPVMIVTRESFGTLSDGKDLAGRRIAANLTQGAVAAAVAGWSHIAVVDVGTVAEGLEAVATDHADAYVGDIATAEAVIRSEYPTRLRLAAATDERAAFAIAVSQRYARLVPLIDRALARMPERHSQAIRNTWLRSQYTWGGSWREIARKVGPAGGVVIVLLLTVSHGYLRLRRETRRRRESEEQLADVTRHIPAVVYRFLRHADETVTFSYVGGNPEPIFGIDAQTILADERLAYARVDPRDQAALLATVAHSAATLEPLHAELRVRDIHPERWVASHALPRRLGDAVEFTGYWIDVSERHQQSEQLAAAKLAAESATAAKSRFLATMSHEIRTPMHGVIGTLEMLRDTELDETQSHLLATAATSAEALLHILDDVLDFSRIEAGSLAVAPTRTDVRRLVASVIDLFAWHTASKGLVMSTRVDDRLAPALLVDGGRLRQILLNLISNAIKFTDEGSVTVEVGVVRDAGARQIVRFVVADTGIGIEDADAARLFSPFIQADDSISRRFGGSGLGLAITRRLVELMGGHIELTGRPGEGTRVTVTMDLPIASPVDEAVSSTGDAKVAPPARDVLVAEDHPVNRELVAAQLQRLGHRCRIACDGAEALKMAADAPADVVLTDLHMPGMDGYALARALRARGATMRIVAMTADVMASERERCLAAGMDDVVSKPLRLDELRNAIDPSFAPAAAVEAGDEDTAHWHETFGDLSVLPEMLSRFEASLRADIDRLPKIGTTTEAMQWVHRISGGMRIFGDSAEASEVEALGRKLVASDGLAPAPLDSLYTLVPTLERFVARLKTLIDRQAATEHLLKH